MSAEHVSVPRELEELAEEMEDEASELLQNGEIGMAEEISFFANRLRTVMCGTKSIDELKRIVDRNAIKRALTRLYTAGYLSGHHDTVEGNYTDIVYADRDTYFCDNVTEILQDSDYDAILSRATPSDERITATNWPQPSAPRVVTDEDVMRARKAYAGVLGYVVHEGRNSMYDTAMRAALESFATSLPAAGEPDGWKLVPLVPTAEMEDAAFDTFEIDDAKTQGFNSGTEARNAIYKAMLAAAPQE